MDFVASCEKAEECRNRSTGKCTSLRGNEESKILNPESVTENLERKHVMDVYDSIANHFSHTRYKPWPQVKQFLESLPPYSIIADIGCGNGKYLNCRREFSGELKNDGKLTDKNSGRNSGQRDDESDVKSTAGKVADTNESAADSNMSSVTGGPNHFSAFRCLSFGFDFSVALLRCAQKNGLGIGNLVTANCLKIPTKDCSFDASICIAVIHHLTSEERRLRAISELSRITKEGGSILLYVWAVEQKERSIGARKFDSNNVLLPWRMQPHHLAESEGLNDGSMITLYRYYHLFTKDEVLQLCAKEKTLAVEGCVFDSNNWAVHLKKLPELELS